MICVCWTAKMIQVERRLTAKQNKATSDTEEEGTRRDEYPFQPWRRVSSPSVKGRNDHEQE